MGTTRTENSHAVSLSAWQARAVHTITLPSGQIVKIRIPGIATLLEHGDLPEDLFEIATAEIMDTISADGIEGPTVIPGSVQWVSKAEERNEKLTRLRAFGAFQRQLVAAALIEPALSYEEITEAVERQTLPEDDLAMVAEIVQRIRFRDAMGVRIGVEPLDRWATFRQEHKGIACTGDEDCPGCQKILQRFSSLDVDEV